MCTTLNGAPGFSYTLQRIHAGEVTRVDGAGPSTAELQQFGYDERGRLSSSSASYTVNGQPATHAGTYTSDLANNLMGGLTAGRTTTITR